MHYMSADSAGRDQLLTPLATILHLSQEEVNTIIIIMKALKCKPSAQHDIVESIGMPL